MIAELSLYEGIRWLGKALSAAGFRSWDVTDDGLHYRQVTEGVGWSQPAGVRPEAWPPGALGCLRVSWIPDPAYQRDCRTGHVPSGAAEHWQASTKALLGVLRELGLGAAVTGPPRTAETHTSAELLVWQPGPDTPAQWSPPGAWAGVPPTRPNHVDGWPRWNEPDPCREVADALRVRARKREVEGQPAIGSVSVRDQDGVLWPPGAHACVCALWCLAEGHRRDASGPRSAASQLHWHGGIGQLQDDLSALGYQSRTAWEHHAATREGFARVLVWRGARPAASP
ncbi:hypothetical protein [Streptomyces sp. Y1]|uniref:Uncharacterized protein n=1 Tax=Streptomyces sp. Y1 TaxID=3238634 RepID=A0AB39TXN0_9ACTN